tara:strand:- start:807 stop:1223 length:417 start_codon:yes stop_codon:yes gene_type:complete
MTNQKTGQVKACYDNSEDGIPNFCIDLIDGTRLYTRGEKITMPEKGDTISYNIINTKESKTGNLYSNVSSVKVVDGNAPEANTSVSSGGSGKSSTQRLDIFVTGVVGRAMGSGHYSVADIPELTKKAVQSFNENLKEL